MQLWVLRGVISLIKERKNNLDFPIYSGRSISCPEQLCFKLFMSHKGTQTSALPFGTSDNPYIIRRVFLSQKPLKKKHLLRQKNPLIPLDITSYVSLPGLRFIRCSTLTYPLTLCDVSSISISRPSCSRLVPLPLAKPQSKRRLRFEKLQKRYKFVL